MNQEKAKEFLKEKYPNHYKMFKQNGDLNAIAIYMTHFAEQDKKHFIEAMELYLSCDFRHVSKEDILQQINNLIQKFKQNKAKDKKLKDMAVSLSKKTIGNILDKKMNTNKAEEYLIKKGYENDYPILLDEMAKDMQDFAEQYNAELKKKNLELANGYHDIIQELNHLKDNIDEAKKQEAIGFAKFLIELHLEDSINIDEAEIDLEYLYKYYLANNQKFKEGK
jgi:hypothetical protein